MSSTRDQTLSPSPSFLSLSLSPSPLSEPPSSVQREGFCPRRRLLPSREGRGGRKIWCRSLRHRIEETFICGRFSSFLHAPPLRLLGADPPPPPPFETRRLVSFLAVRPIVNSSGTPSSLFASPPFSHVPPARPPIPRRREEMGSGPNTAGGWFLDYGGLEDEVQGADFIWQTHIGDDPTQPR